MKMTCPHCGVVGAAPGSMPGEKVRCPQCHKVFMLIEQKTACPHCGVDGSAGVALPGTKLKCPRCEKIFLLTPERLAVEAVRDVVVADTAGAMAAAATGVEVSAETELLSPVAATEPVVELLPEVVSVTEEELIIEPVAEVELVMESELEAVPEPAAEIELELIDEPEPKPESLLETEVVETEPAAESAEIGTVTVEQVEVVQEIETGVTEEVTFESAEELADAESGEIEVEAEMVSRAVPVAEEGHVEPTVMPAEVCAGCGDSFHPEFLQEVDSKLYCGVCQLRSAAMDVSKQTPESGGRKIGGILAALMLLGLLALVVLALKMFGVI